MLETNKALISKEERVCGWRLAGLVTLLSSSKYEWGVGVAGLLAVCAAAAVCYHDRCWSSEFAPFLSLALRARACFLAAAGVLKCPWAGGG